MRVIAGEFRSRKLKSVSGMEVRPTPDRLREALFSVLMPRIAGSTFLDCYAGSGAVGIEALSRGAARAVFIERKFQAIAILKENLKTLGLEERASVVHGDASRLVSHHAANVDIAFLDPPYPMEGEYKASLDALASAACPLVIAQHATRFALAETYGQLTRFRELRQGDNCLSFFAPQKAS